VVKTGEITVKLKLVDQVSVPLRRLSWKFQSCAPRGDAALTRTNLHRFASIECRSSALPWPLHSFASGDA
jgi:hypothetical protein